MNFIYHKDAKSPILTIDGELYQYLFKVRRTGSSEVLNFRNLIDFNIYSYKIVNISKKEATLSLNNYYERKLETKKELHIGWCVIEPKNIEKVLPSLNEIGVSKISLFYCARSQKSYKLDLERIGRILINSSMQCGRSSIIKVEILKDIYEFIKLYPNSYIFNFSSNLIDNKKDEIKTIVVGCEGGFIDSELELFGDKIVGVDTNLILKSETATLAVATKIIL